MTGPQDLPRQFGHYQIERKLGQGGMGSVWLALDTRLARWVALKVPHFAPEDGPTIIQRFLREAHIAANIEHPHLCPVYDVGEVQGIRYFTMPFIEGWPLSALLANGPMPGRQAAELVRKLALALHELHQRGILHRDLKPGNIMIRKSGEPILMDFGLARSFTSQSQRLTSSTGVMGTPAYMSPEQISGQPNLTPAADVWSLGVILYECLTGHLPFEGPLMSVLYQVVHGRAAPPSSLTAGLDPRLEAVCMKALSRDPGQRFGSALELARALEASLSLAAIQIPAGPAVPGSAPTTPLTIPPELAGSTMPVSQTVREPGLTGESAVPKALLLGAALLVAVSIGAAVTYLATRPRDAGGNAGTDPTRATSTVRPKVRITSPLTVKVMQGRSVPLRIEVERTAFTGPVRIVSQTQSPGLTVTLNEIPANRTEAAGTVAADTQARPGTRELTLELQFAEQTQPATLTVTVEARPEFVAGTTHTSKLGIKLVYIPAGKFTMGTPDRDRWAGDNWSYPEGPPHRVEISRGFWMGAYEITVGQFKQFCDEEGYKTEPERRGDPRTWRNAFDGQTDEHPVCQVSWHDAMAFCKWLSRKEGVTCDLPTEAEWEYACKAGTSTRYHFGDDAGPLGEYSPRVASNPQRVGQYRPSPWGLYDLHGNVYEWCKDGKRDYDTQDQKDPEGPVNARRVTRGGSYLSDPMYCRSTYRRSAAAEYRGIYVGFRVVFRVSDRRP